MSPNSPEREFSLLKDGKDSLSSLKKLICEIKCLSPQFSSQGSHKKNILNGNDEYLHKSLDDYFKSVWRENISCQAFIGK